MIGDIMTKNETNIHSGHRDRLRSLYLQNGLDALSDHQVLEFILMHAIPRIDVNPLAHKLMQRYGSLSAVFDASPDELMLTDGIGPGAAALLSLFRKVERRYHIDHNAREKTLLSVESAGKYLAPYFIAEQEEVVYAVSVAPSGRILKTSLLFRGTADTSMFYINQIITLAASKGTAGILLAHNHPNGIALPSAEDIRTTATVADALEKIGSMLVDHLIFADNDFISMSDSGYIKNSIKKEP